MKPISPSSTSPTIEQQSPPVQSTSNVSTVTPSPTIVSSLTKSPSLVSSSSEPSLSRRKVQTKKQKQEEEREKKELERLRKHLRQCRTLLINIFKGERAQCQDIFSEQTVAIVQTALEKSVDSLSKIQPYFDRTEDEPVLEPPLPSFNRMLRIETRELERLTQHCSKEADIEKEKRLLPQEKTKKEEKTTEARSSELSLEELSLSITSEMAERVVHPKERPLASSKTQQKKKVQEEKKEEEKQRKKTLVAQKEVRKGTPQEKAHDRPSKATDTNPLQRLPISRTFPEELTISIEEVGRESTSIITTIPYVEVANAKTLTLSETLQNIKDTVKESRHKNLFMPELMPDKLHTIQDVVTALSTQTAILTCIYSVVVGERENIGQGHQSILSIAEEIISENPEDMLYNDPISLRKNIGTLSHQKSLEMNIRILSLTQELFSIIRHNLLKNIVNKEQGISFVQDVHICLQKLLHLLGEHKQSSKILLTVLTLFRMLKNRNLHPSMFSHENWNTFITECHKKRILKQNCVVERSIKDIQTSAAYALQKPGLFLTELLTTVTIPFLPILQRIQEKQIREQQSSSETPPPLPPRRKKE
ncbi:MAG: hypothetical protein ACRCV3_05925 [Desulfovibrionaceae bacterium]